MALQLKVKTLDEIPEPLRSYYVAQADGTWEIDGFAETTAGLQSALRTERAENKELKTLSPDDRTALLAGADLHAEFRAFMQQRDALATSDKNAIASERDAAKAAENAATARLMLAGEFLRLGGNYVTVELIAPLYADRIRFDAKGEITILTETGQPALPGCTVHDLALAAHAKFPSQFK